MMAAFNSSGLLPLTGSGIVSPSPQLGRRVMWADSTGSRSLAEIKIVSPLPYSAYILSPSPPKTGQSWNYGWPDSSPAVDDDESGVSRFAPSLSSSNLFGNTLRFDAIAQRMEQQLPTRSTDERVYDFDEELASAPSREAEQVSEFMSELAAAAHTMRAEPPLAMSTNPRSTGARTDRGHHSAPVPSAPVHMPTRVAARTGPLRSSFPVRAVLPHQSVPVRAVRLQGMHSTSGPMSQGPRPVSPSMHGAIRAASPRVNPAVRAPAVPFTGRKLASPATTPRTKGTPSAAVPLTQSARMQQFMGDSSRRLGFQGYAGRAPTRSENTRGGGSSWIGAGAARLQEALSMDSAAVDASQSDISVTREIHAGSSVAPVTSSETQDDSTQTVERRDAVSNTLDDGESVRVFMEAAGLSLIQEPEALPPSRQDVGAAGGSAVTVHAVQSGVVHNAHGSGRLPSLPPSGQRLRGSPGHLKSAGSTSAFRTTVAGLRSSPRAGTSLVSMQPSYVSSMDHATDVSIASSLNTITHALSFSEAGPVAAARELSSAVGVGGVGDSIIALQSMQFEEAAALGTAFARAVAAALADRGQPASSMSMGSLLEMAAAGSGSGRKAASSVAALDSMQPEGGRQAPKSPMGSFPEVGLLENIEAAATAVSADKLGPAVAMARPSTSPKPLLRGALPVPVSQLLSLVGTPLDSVTAQALASRLPTQHAQETAKEALATPIQGKVGPSLRPLPSLGVVEATMRNMLAPDIVLQAPVRDTMGVEEAVMAQEEAEEALFGARPYLPGAIRGFLSARSPGLGDITAAHGDSDHRDLVAVPLRTRFESPNRGPSSGNESMAVVNRLAESGFLSGSMPILHGDSGSSVYAVRPSVRRLESVRQSVLVASPTMHKEQEMEQVKSQMPEETLQSVERMQPTVTPDSRGQVPTLALGQVATEFLVPVIEAELEQSPPKAGTVFQHLQGQRALILGSPGCTASPTSGSHSAHEVERVPTPPVVAPADTCGDEEMADRMREELVAQLAQQRAHNRAIDPARVSLQPDSVDCAPAARGDGASSPSSLPSGRPATGAKPSPTLALFRRASDAVKTATAFERLAADGAKRAASRRGSNASVMSSSGPGPGVFASAAIAIEANTSRRNSSASVTGTSALAAHTLAKPSARYSGAESVTPRSAGIASKAGIPKVPGPTKGNGAPPRPQSVTGSRVSSRGPTPAGSAKSTPKLGSEARDPPAQAHLPPAFVDRDGLTTERGTLPVPPLLLTQASSGSSMQSATMLIHPDIKKGKDFQDSNARFVTGEVPVEAQSTDSSFLSIIPVPKGETGPVGTPPRPGMQQILSVVDGGDLIAAETPRKVLRAAIGSPAPSVQRLKAEMRPHSGLESHLVQNSLAERRKSPSRFGLPFVGGGIASVDTSVVSTVTSAGAVLLPSAPHQPGHPVPGMSGLQPDMQRFRGPSQRIVGLPSRPVAPVRAVVTLPAAAQMLAHAERAAAAIHTANMSSSMPKAYGLLPVGRGAEATAASRPSPSHAPPYQVEVRGGVAYALVPIAQTAEKVGATARPPETKRAALPSVRPSPTPTQRMPPFIGARGLSAPNAPIILRGDDGFAVKAVHGAPVVHRSGPSQAGRGALNASLPAPLSARRLGAVAGGTPRETSLRAAIGTSLGRATAAGSLLSLTTGATRKGSTPTASSGDHQSTFKYGGRGPAAERVDASFSSTTSVPASPTTKLVSRLLAALANSPDTSAKSARTTKRASA